MNFTEFIVYMQVISQILFNLGVGFVAVVYSWKKLKDNQIKR
jgi:hypothetical protein